MLLIVSVLLAAVTCGDDVCCHSKHQCFGKFIYFYPSTLCCTRWANVLCHAVQKKAMAMTAATSQRGRCMRTPICASCNALFNLSSLLLTVLPTAQHGKVRNPGSCTVTQEASSQHHALYQGIGHLFAGLASFKSSDSVIHCRHFPALCTVPGCWSSCRWLG